jgi:hypothetical protein
MGKSTLAQAIVSSLKGGEDSEEVYPGCQYYFFTFSDVAKRKAAYALRLIAFQLALEHDRFCERLLQLYDSTGMRLEQQLKLSGHILSGWSTYSASKTDQLHQVSTNTVIISPPRQAVWSLP